MAKAWVIMRRVHTHERAPFRVALTEEVAKKAIREMDLQVKQLTGVEGLIHYWYEEVEVEE